MWVALNLNVYLVYLQGGMRVTLIIATDGTLFPCYFPVGIWGYSDDSRDDFPLNHLFPQASDKIKPDI